MEKHSPEEIKAALKWWREATKNVRCDDDGTVQDEAGAIEDIVEIVIAGGILEEIIRKTPSIFADRAANPPAGAESAGGYMEMVGKIADSLPTDDDVELSSAYPGAPLVARPITRRGPITEPATPAVSEWRPHPGAQTKFLNEKIKPQFLLSNPDPATPAVGEDEAIRKWLDARDFIGTEAMMDAGDDLAARVHALLADVARLQKELDGTTFREERYAEDAAGARLALEDARAETLKWVTDHAQLQGKLAAVRKVAENYNNVDFVGDGRIEMTTNPCAAEILNVLEGKP